MKSTVYSPFANGIQVNSLSSSLEKAETVVNETHIFSTTALYTKAVKVKSDSPQWNAKENINLEEIARKQIYQKINKILGEY